jgi:hypothetical protein
VGEKALDRSETIRHRYPPTTSAVLTESGRRMGFDVVGKFLAYAAPAAPWKYQSERRKDQLQAVMRVLAIAALLFAAAAEGGSLKKWNAFLLPLFHVPVWNFPTAILKTPMQRARAP